MAQTLPVLPRLVKYFAYPLSFSVEPLSEKKKNYSTHRTLASALEWTIDPA